MKTSEVLRKALELFGPNGRNWESNSPTSRAMHCAATAIGEASTSCVEFDAAKRAVLTAVGRENSILISSWNDEATWPEVESAFKQAIATAERGEG